ncbi:CueP family metal-binding protein [Microbacterium sp. Sa4CUA7]|uniref:CueP family metal-binding protein n=1 Tax=Microbacterium pullorum TaxID=2762236 RepID=A0ABR8S3P6_9MICO|nr:CueP family metal-binding protein [Microbacterium pullorum]MBD7958104.1 CueP family metal-binding protein [Microbacterium pullorum]
MTTTHFTRPRRALAVGAALAAAAIVLAGCAAATPAAAPPTLEQQVLTEHDLNGLDAAGIIERLDAMPIDERPDDLLASVRPDELIVTDDQDRQISVPMPADETYLSIAPYVAQTHDCYFHSLTTCVGELRNTAVEIAVVDDATGAVLVSESRNTFDNGFVGVWLPRGIQATLTISAEGRSATTAISTAKADDATCITTMQLS